MFGLNGCVVLKFSNAELVREFHMIERVNSGEIDEVWLFGHPYGGYWESIMCGPGAFWCNAPPLAGTEHASRRFALRVGSRAEELGRRARTAHPSAFIEHVQICLDRLQDFGYAYIERVQ